MGLAAEQDGRAAEAASIWRAMLAKAPPNAPWRPLVQAALARVGGSAAPALSDDAVAAAKDMNETDRNAMIRGMVDRLATRLKQNGDDVEGWLRLVRAYMVMGDRDKAKGALHRRPSGRRQRRRAAAATERGPEKSRAGWMSTISERLKRFSVNQLERMMRTKFEAIFG